MKRTFLLVGMLVVLSGSLMAATAPKATPVVDITPPRPLGTIVLRANIMLQIPGGISTYYLSPVNVGVTPEGWTPLNSVGGPVPPKLPFGFEWALVRSGSLDMWRQVPTEPANWSRDIQPGEPL